MEKKENREEELSNSKPELIIIQNKNVILNQKKIYYKIILKALENT